MTNVVNINEVLEGHVGLDLACIDGSTPTFPTSRSAARSGALAGALCCVVHAVTGFTNHSLRGLVAGLLGTDYTASQMTYDLRRLRLHGLIQRVPHTHTYTLTPEGLRVAVFYTKLHRRLLGPLLEADMPPAPLEIRRALALIDKTIADYVTNVRLGTAA